MTFFGFYTFAVIYPNSIGPLLKADPTKDKGETMIDALYSANVRFDRNFKACSLCKNTLPARGGHENKIVNVFLSLVFYCACLL